VICNRRNSCVGAFSIVSTMVAVGIKAFCAFLGTIG
jgi:hypothetical protein